MRPPHGLLEVDFGVRDDDGHEVGEADAGEDAGHDGGRAEHPGRGRVLGLNAPARENDGIYSF